MYLTETKHIISVPKISKQDYSVNNRIVFESVFWNITHRSFNTLFDQNMKKYNRKHLRENKKYHFTLPVNWSNCV